MPINSTETVPVSAVSLLPARPPSATVTGLRTDQLTHRVGLAGLCSDSASDKWYPDASKFGSREGYAAYARAVCLGCSVLAECLELALRIEERVAGGPHGIWGGTIPQERKVMLAARRQAVRRA